MVLGMSLAVFTLLHTVISLIAIAAGIVVLIGMLGSHRLLGWTAIFLLFTIFTSVTGFLFPIYGFSPALGVGVLSCILLAIALVAFYGKYLEGASRWIYVTTAIASLYLNVFVLIVQSFGKVSFLNAHAPQVGPPFSEPANTHFMIAQGMTLVFFVVVGAIAAFRFRPTILM